MTQKRSNYRTHCQSMLSCIFKIYLSIYLWVKTKANELSVTVHAIKTRSSLLVQRCVRANRPTTCCLRGHGSHVNKRLDRGDPSLMPSAVNTPEITVTKANQGGTRRVATSVRLELFLVGESGASSPRVADNTAPFRSCSH